MSKLDPVLGRSDTRAWHDYQVKGTLLASRPRYVLEQWGEAAVRDVAARLDPEARALFEAPAMPFAWTSFRTLAAIDRAIVHGPMNGDVSAMKHFGATIARYDLPTLYKVLFKLGTPAFILRRINIAYGQYVRGGNVTTTDVTATSARGHLVEGALPMYFCRYGIAGWLTSGIELSGGREVHVEEASCIHRGDAQCTWNAAWV